MVVGTAVRRWSWWSWRAVVVKRFWLGRAIVLVGRRAVVMRRRRRVIEIVTAVVRAIEFWIMVRSLSMVLWFVEFGFIGVGMMGWTIEGWAIVRTEAVVRTGTVVRRFIELRWRRWQVVRWRSIKSRRWWRRRGSVVTWAMMLAWRRVSADRQRTRVRSLPRR